MDSVDIRKVQCLSRAGLPIAHVLSQVYRDDVQASRDALARAQEAFGDKLRFDAVIGRDLFESLAPVDQCKRHWRGGRCQRRVAEVAVCQVCGSCCSEPAICRDVPADPELDSLRRLVRDAL